MGRSVSYPAGAQVAFCELGCDADADWDWEYECLVDAIRREVQSAFPSFDPVDCWREREDRVLMRNTFADIGISTYSGIAAIWIAERDDPAYAWRHQWASYNALAQNWLACVKPKFDALFSTLDRIGTMSNGETFYQHREAA